jgi:flagellar biosynthetic protein FliR
LSAQAALITVQQLVTGAALGLLLRIAFGALELAGDAISHLMGLSFASMIDPVNGVATPVLSQLYGMLATLVFLSFNGHLLWIEAVAESFRLLPVAAQGLAPQGLWALIGFGSELFVWGVRMALPVIAALLVINVAFGVLTRAAPQLNLFSVGFPVTMVIGFILLVVSLPAVLHKVLPLNDAALAGAARLLVGG